MKKAVNTSTSQKDTPGKKETPARTVMSIDDWKKQKGKDVTASEADKGEGNSEIDVDQEADDEIEEPELDEETGTNTAETGSQISRLMEIQEELAEIGFTITPIPEGKTPSLRFGPRVYQQLRSGIIKEQEGEILTRLKPEQFIDKDQYDTAVRHIQDEIARLADQVIDMYTATLLANHPHKREITNIRGILSTMDVDLPMEAAEALAVLVNRHINEFAASSGKKQESRKQAFVEGASQRYSQEPVLSPEEKKLLKNLNISPKTYARYRDQQ